MNEGYLEKLLGRTEDRFELPDLPAFMINQFKEIFSDATFEQRSDGTWAVEFHPHSEIMPPLLPTTLDELKKQKQDLEEKIKEQQLQDIKEILKEKDIEIHNDYEDMVVCPSLSVELWVEDEQVVFRAFDSKITFSFDVLQRREARTRQEHLAKRMAENHEIIKRILE
jgi:hypothetical protein